MSEPAKKIPGRSLQSSIVKLGYAPSIKNGILTAPNRAQGLRLSWTNEGMQAWNEVPGIYWPLSLSHLLGVLIH